MGALLKALITVFWPFIVEVFFKKGDVSDIVGGDGEGGKMPYVAKLLTGIIFTGLTIFYFYDALGKSLLDSQDRYREISREYMVLEEDYRTLADAHRVLKNDLFEVNRQLAIMERQWLELSEARQRLEEENEALKEQAVVATEPEIAYRSSNVEELLRRGH